MLPLYNYKLIKKPAFFKFFTEESPLFTVLKPLARLTIASAVGLASTASFADVTRSLPLPSGTPSADEIIDQVYYVNHFYGFDNYGIGKKGKKITVLVNKSAGEKPTTVTVERYLNNDYEDDDTIKARDLAIFRSGKLRGTGMLVTDYDEPGKTNRTQSGFLR